MAACPVLSAEGAGGTLQGERLLSQALRAASPATSARQKPARAERADFQQVPRELPAAQYATAVPPARSGSQPKDEGQALPRAPRSHNSLYFHELDIPCSNHCSGVLSPGWTPTHTACSVGVCSGPTPGPQHGPAAHSPAGRGHWAPLAPHSPAWNELLQPHIR